ncbi:hypothetical protein [Microcystis aeruginosa]|uniref:Similarity n=3 Tax=Microcystaceae TaxID=1890449 RepID=A8YGA1_MICA7|nr:hypothetical protein [Microcystis aeruginosa]ARI81536.1 hypothetical protein BH695_2255 [Microcystis aeruginosa PCC 7806SL]ELS47986.1 hypothetical protein C789_2216 [Microcystis aeruginosa FACHB-905 = DIANCHI905]UGS07206.1 hypothetical protein LRR78_12925 [Microcystis aeruginosa FACHB-905 = DIANCHI905]WKX64546.1 hypothetical protein Q3H53_004759 [Microcystis aeruginosa PCC 7806]CAO87205.1 unnamed protein product [Microcystis aeruginosa PCC 7806]
MSFSIRVPSLITPVYCIRQTEEPKIFTGNKGECKRADFIIIANTPTEKVILCLEMKKSRDSNSSIIKQLKGAECFVSYCREIGRLFWNQPDFLQDYQYRFVSIKNISISKTTTSSRKPSQKSEIHDQPEKMLKISAEALSRINLVL